MIHFNYPPIRIYVNKIKNIISFKLLELLLPETIKLLESTKIKINKNKNGKNMPQLEITEIVLVHCNIVNNDYQHDSRDLYTFFPNKFFGKLLDIISINFIFLKTFNSEFSYTEVWFTDQISKPLEIEVKVNITLVLN